MNRRPGAHSLLSTPSYPTSSRSISPSISDDPYSLSEYDRNDKKNGLYGGNAYGNQGSSGLGMAGAAAGGYSSNSFGNRTAEDLEEQNDLKLEGLSAKVRMLKDVSRVRGKEMAFKRWIQRWGGEIEQVEMDSSSKSLCA